MFDVNMQYLECNLGHIFSFFRKNITYSRDLKLKLVGGPYSRVKMLRVPQFKRKKLLRAAIYIKSHKNKLNLIKLYTLVIFLRGPHKCIWRATCGPRASCLRPLTYRITSSFKHSKNILSCRQLAILESILPNIFLCKTKIFSVFPC
jgi:hypothetical protein